MSSTISVSEYDALYDGFCRVRAERDAAIARAEAAEAEVKALREALTPFAAAWADTVNVFDRNTKTLGVFGAVCGYYATGTDYRRAHQALNPPSSPEPSDG